MNAAIVLGEKVGPFNACKAIGASRATLYRRRRPAKARAHSAPRRSHRALSMAERQVVLDILHSERFVDRPPVQVHATLLDEETYVCAPRTMYRILDSVGEVRERRDQRSHPSYAKPVLLATQPNQVWTWDITKIPGPARGIWFALYVMLDLFSRYVVGWLLADRESEDLARDLMQESLRRQAIQPGQLTIHADRGPQMVAKSVAQFMSDIGVARSHSRPRVSNDNPYSESHFKTIKYRPEFPSRLGSLQHGREVIGRILNWYHHEHRHSGLGLLTPAAVHFGDAAAVVETRRRVLGQAYAAHPERFPGGRPVPAALPTAVWINRPDDEVSRGGLALQTTADLKVSQTC